MDSQLPSKADTVQVEFSVSLGDGKFNATAVVPAGQTTLTQILPVLRSLEDSLIAGVTGQLSQAGRTVSCRAGCGACCRQMVPVSIFEAESLAAAIRTLPAEVQEALKARFDQALRQFSSAGMIDRMVTEDWLAETASAREMALQYLYQRIACPFLENESCSIHAIRPMACREYLVTSPSEHCYDPTTDKVQAVALPIHFSRRLHQMGAQLENDARGWIPLIFLFAWMKAEAAPGDRIAGDGPQVLYEFLKDLQHAAYRP